MIIVIAVHCFRFKVLRVVTMKVDVSWDMTPHKIVNSTNILDEPATFTSPFTKVDTGN
jgi:hypothetical protein